MTLPQSCKSGLRRPPTTRCMSRSSERRRRLRGRNRSRYRCYRPHAVCIGRRRRPLHKSADRRWANAWRHRPGRREAMWEQIFIDPSSGQPLTGSLQDYTLPRAAYLPSFRTKLSKFCRRPIPTYQGGRRGRYDARVGGSCQRHPQCVGTAWRQRCSPAGHGLRNLAGRSNCQEAQRLHGSELRAPI